MSNYLNMKNNRVYLMLILVVISYANIYAQYEVTSLGGTFYVAQGESVWVRGAGGNRNLWK
ncbi:MAG: hypothetical protein KatS3mg035_1509 [Bacteroidia bacterium]|nr:MAG: hypothetical protein KatS3mg035_1509 [Bacteroidia bacterium]